MRATNYDGRLEQMAYYCEAMLDNIAKVNNAYHDSVENKYAATLPNHLIKWKGIKKIGGKTVVMNQLYDGSGTSSTVSDVVCTCNNDGTWTLNGTASADGTKTLVSGLTLKANHYYMIQGCPSGGSADTFYLYMNGLSNNDWDIGNGIVAQRANSDTGGATLRIIFKSGVVFDNLVFKPQYIDLTKMFGVGNEPTTLEDAKAILSADFYAHNAGTLLSAGVTSVVSKDSNNDTLQTYSIPVEITTLEGYGWSCPGAYNYIDFTNKKFVYAVGTRAYEAGDESDATVITDGTNTHYKLDEPLAFDVELPDETITIAESGGNLTFENQYGDDYKIPVPVKMEYIGVS